MMSKIKHLFFCTWSKWSAPVKGSMHQTRHGERTGVSWEAKVQDRTCTICGDYQIKRAGE